MLFRRPGAPGLTAASTTLGPDALDRRPGALAGRLRPHGRGLLVLPAVGIAVLAVAWLGWQTGRAAPEASAAPVAADAPVTAAPASGASGSASPTGRPARSSPPPTVTRTPGFAKPGAVGEPSLAGPSSAATSPPLTARPAETTGAPATAAPSTGGLYVTPTPSTAHQAGGSGAAGGGTDWRAVLAHADTARAAAFARLDSAGLLAADAAGSPAWAGDAAAMRQLTARGAFVRGLHKTVSGLSLRSGSSDRAVLRLVEVLAPYAFVDSHGSVLATKPGGTAQVDVTLVRVGQQWRVSQVDAVRG